MTRISAALPVSYGSVVLRFPVAEDRDEFVVRASDSVEFHNKLVNPPLNAEAFDEYLKRISDYTELGFLVIEKVNGRIAGVVNVSQIFLKGFCSAYLGYYLFSEFCGRGLMTDAVSGVVGYLFEHEGLHRLEANIQPENTASINVVKRCGFVKEGFSRKYLKIDGEWRDHERWAIIKEDWETFSSDDK